LIKYKKLVEKYKGKQLSSKDKAKIRIEKDYQSIHFETKD